MSHRTDSREQLETGTSQGTELFFISESATTKTIPFSGKVLEFPSSMTLGKALHSLAEFHVLSAPVWDEDTKQYLGFIDVFDFLTLAVGVDVLVHLLPSELMSKRPKNAAELEFQKEMTLKELMTSEEGALMGFNPWCPVSEGADLRLVVKLLATKARRVPVLSADTGRVIQIISQSQICSLLAEYVKKVGEHETLAQTGYGIKPVLMVKDTDCAREAFQVMVENKVSSVPVINSETGKVMTAISTKDIRLLPKLEALALDSGKKTLFDLSCIEFAQLVRKDDFKTKAACVVVELDATLETVLGKLAKTKMHRVYVVNKEKKPVGVVSVSDVVVALQQIQPQ